MEENTYARPVMVQLLVSITLLHDLPCSSRYAFRNILHPRPQWSNRVSQRPRGSEYPDPRAIRVQISRRSRFLYAVLFSSTMDIIAIVLHSLTDVNLQVFANAATFMAILAIPFVCMNSERKTHAEDRDMAGAK
jgi:hypothetical protein